MSTINIALTGASGFVGSAILRRLVLEKNAGNNVHCRALVRTPGSVTTEVATLVQGDLDAIPAALFPPDEFVLVHFATKQVDNDGTGFETTNLHGTQHLLRQLPPQCRGILYGSTLSVYGQGAQSNIGEGAPLNPETPLAKTRADAEMMILAHARSHQIPAYTLRPRFILGEGDRYTIHYLKQLAQMGIQIGDGEQRYAVIDVDDYAAIVTALAQRMLSASPAAVEQRPLNIGYLEPLSLRDILHTLAAHCGYNDAFQKIPYEMLFKQLVGVLPASQQASKKTQLELIGFDHYGNTQALLQRVDATLLQRCPIAVLTQAAQLTL